MAEVGAGGPAAVAARDRFRDQIGATGHAVDNVRIAVAGLRTDIDAGNLQLTPAMAQMLEDLRVALEQDDAQKLGGKSAEAARFISKALLREIDRQTDNP